MLTDPQGTKMEAERLLKMLSKEQIGQLQELVATPLAVRFEQTPQEAVDTVIIALAALNKKPAATDGTRDKYDTPEKIYGRAWRVLQDQQLYRNARRLAENALQLGGEMHY